jgi:YHS domain-containing protein
MEEPETACRARRSQLHMTRDHVCDMEIDERKPAITAEYADDTYYFCSQECKNKFVEDPEKYVSRTEASQT